MKNWILILLLLVFGILSSKTIYFGPSQSLATFDEAFQIAETGDHLIQTEKKTYHFSKEINWLSFDVLWEDEDDNIAEYFLADIQQDLIYAKFKPHSANSTPLTIQYEPSPLYLNHPFTSPYGYKFYTDADCQFTVIGNRWDPDDEFDLYDGENWIGYYLEDSQHVYDAFSGHLDDILSIKHQDWSVKYNNGWPDVGYTLCAGDMVVVDCDVDILDFSWPDPNRIDPFIVLEPQLYSFTEEADYIPIYIDFNENDLPDEIGVFLDDECVGARVVQHEFENVCTYITEAQNGDIEIEFAYYDRGTRQRYNQYTVYDEETGYRETTTINLKDYKQDYYYISFNSQPGNNSTPQSNEITISNSPNPFNPSTSIYYNLPIEDNVQLSIYNLKGQKVKNLAEGTQPAGNYNVIWDGTDSTGKSVSSGVYFYQISTSSQTIKKKMLLLK